MTWWNLWWDEFHALHCAFEFDTKSKSAEPPVRIELTTPGLQDQCSSHWAMEACFLVVTGLKPTNWSPNDQHLAFAPFSHFWSSWVAWKLRMLSFLFVISHFQSNWQYVPFHFSEINYCLHCGKPTINIFVKNQAFRFWRGSNSRPSACKADVITTTPQNPVWFTMQILTTTCKNKNAKLMIFQRGNWWHYTLW